MKRPSISGPINYRIETVRFLVCREGAVATSSQPVVSEPGAVIELSWKLIPDDAREYFYALYLNAQNRIVAAHEVSVGTLCASLVHPRDVFGPALRLLGVASIILVHNHPSGDPTPSQEDVRLTRQLAEAARILDLGLHDHLILGNGTTNYISLAECGLI